MRGVSSRKATTKPARKLVGEVVEFLREEFGYEGDDLPTGDLSQVSSCPIAMAICTTHEGDSDCDVSVGTRHIMFDGKYRFKTVEFGRRYGPGDVPRVPVCVRKFINRFDIGMKGYEAYRS